MSEFIKTNNKTSEMSPLKGLEKLFGLNEIFWDVLGYLLEKKQVFIVYWILLNN